MPPRLTLPLLTVVLLSTACKKEAPPPSAPQTPVSSGSPSFMPPAGTTGSSASDAREITVAGLKFSLPEGWKSMPPSNSMRLAEIHVLPEGEGGGEICTIAISTAGGGVQGNIDRWAGQVDGEARPVQTRDVAGMKVHIAEFVGAYAGMGEGPVKDNWMLRGAIIETPAALVFVKMTGPTAAMEAAAAKFGAFVDSITRG